MIYFQKETELGFSLDEKLARKWLQGVAAGYGKKVGEIHYVLCDDERILEVNRQFLNHDYYTDVITFDYCVGHTLHGDVFISIDTVRSNAEEAGCSVEEELHRILAHGLLHLCGQDDKTPELRAEMTQKEDKALEEWRGHCALM